MNNRCASTNSPPQKRGSFVSSTLLIALGLCCSATPACGQAPTIEKLAAPSDPATLPRGEDWTQWRGPRSNGLAMQTALPSAWPKAAPEPRWVAPLGEGWSSPIVAAGKVYVLDRKAELERVAAYDADTGKLAWERTNPVDFDPHQVGRRHGNGPKGTAAFADGYVYTVGIAGWMQCLKVDNGELVWKHYFPEEFADPVPLPDGRAYVVGEDHVIVPISDGPGGVKRGAQVPLFGYTGSPLVFGEFVIAATGGVRGGTITAFDRKTGKVAWHALRENVSYSSPVAAEIGGVKQVVVATGPRLVGLELATGKLLWDVPYQNQYDETIGTPVVAGDHVLLMAVGRPLSAWRIARDTAGGFAATELWRNEDFSSYLSSVIVVGDYVYGMNDGGEWNCAKLSDGKMIWRGGSHGYYTTPIVAENRILALNERGTLDIVAANPEKYEPISSLRLMKDATWSTPAIVADRLYIRSKSALLCFELK